MKFLPSVLSRSASGKNSLGIIRPHFGSKGGSAIHWINHDLPVDSAIVFLNAYRLDSAIQQLNNRDHLKSNVENSGIGSLDTVSHQSWTTSSYKVTSSENWIIRENRWSEICSVRYWFKYMLTTLRKEKQRKGEIQSNLAISNSVNSKSPLFRRKIECPWIYPSPLRFPSYFEAPLFRTFFHFPWDFEIAGFNCNEKGSSRVRITVRTMSL